MSFVQLQVPHKDTDYWLPVRLVDSVDYVTGETGKAFGDVTVKLTNAETGTVNTITITTNDWIEIDGGDYWLQIGAGTNEFDSYGRFRLTVESSGCVTYRAIVQVGVLIGSDSNSISNLFQQIRRTHSGIGGTKVSQDASAANPTQVHRNEDDSGDLMTITTTESGDTTTCTPS